LPILGGGLTLAPLEVFWKEHRNLNGKWKVANDLLRYTISELSAGSPLIEVWDPTPRHGWRWATTSSRWRTADRCCPCRTCSSRPSRPRRSPGSSAATTTGGTSLVAVTNRIRRGSRILESIDRGCERRRADRHPVDRSDQPARPDLGVAQSADSTGVVFTSTSKLLPGFCYLTQNPPLRRRQRPRRVTRAPRYPRARSTRIGILGGVQDAQYTALGATGALYAGRWASYGRQRVRQRIIVALNA